MAQGGDLIGIEGPVVRLEFVAREIVRLSHQFKIKRIHYDRVYSADLRIALKDIGSTVELVDLGQGVQSFAPLVSKLSSRPRSPARSAMADTRC